MPLPLLVALLGALIVATFAAVSDHRSGEIPNWVTLPPIVGAPLIYGVTLGFNYGVYSLLATVLSGLAPYLLFRRRAMGGGDVKLFAALGALTGFDLLAGLEIQLLSVCVAILSSFCRLAWDGALARTLGGILAVSLNPVLPNHWRREPPAELLKPIRLGVSVFIATGLFAAPTFAFAWSGT